MVRAFSSFMRCHQEDLYTLDIRVGGLDDKDTMSIHLHAFLFFLELRIDLSVTVVCSWPLPMTLVGLRAVVEASEALLDL